MVQMDIWDMVDKMVTGITVLEERIDNLDNWLIEHGKEHLEDDKDWIALRKWANEHQEQARGAGSIAQSGK